MGLTPEPWTTGWVQDDGSKMDSIDVQRYLLKGHQKGYFQTQINGGFQPIVGDIGLSCYEKALTLPGGRTQREQFTFHW